MPTSPLALTPDDARETMREARETARAAHPAVWPHGDATPDDAERVREAETYILDVRRQAGRSPRPEPTA